MRSRTVLVVAGLSLSTPALAQSEARFIAVPGQSGVPGCNPDFCGLSGSTGYSGVRISDDGAVVATVIYQPGQWKGAVPTRAGRWTEEGGLAIISPTLPWYGVTGISANGNTVYGESWRWRTGDGYEDLRPRLSSNGLFQTRVIFGCSADGATVAGIEGIYPETGDFLRWRIDEAAPEVLPRAAEFPDGYFFFNTISADGRVVAGSTRRPNPKTFADTYAGVVVGASGPVIITPESEGAGVTDLTSDGSIAVGYQRDGVPLRAFRWSRETGTVLIDGGQSDGSYARAVSADGGVIVGDYIVFGEAGTRAFVWRDGAGFMDLASDLAMNYNLADALAGWTLLVATDISADGLSIVGQGVNPEGIEQAFVVRLPAPCRADFDGSGAVNSQDFFAFLEAFFQEQAASDLDRNGVVDSRDFFGFLGAFFNGC